MLSGGAAREGERTYLVPASMTGIAIALFVRERHRVRDQRESSSEHRGRFESQSEAEKSLVNMKPSGSVSGFLEWPEVVPDVHGDWVNQRKGFENTSPLAASLALRYPQYLPIISLGVSTNRDAWCYNASSCTALESVSRMIEFLTANSADTRCLRPARRRTSTNS